MNRAEFLKKSCMGACGLVIGGSVLTALQGCSSFKVQKADVVGGKITLPLESFALTPHQIVRASQYDYDILVIQKPDNQYTALVMQCTHQDWGLIANEKGLNCTAHGSFFDLEGKVINGPAVRPLTQLVNRVENNQLIISIL